MRTEPQLPRPWVIAHRGQVGEQENTLAAFEWAIQIGADMVEFDVRRTQDGILVIHHDAQIQQQSLQDLTYAQLCGYKPVPTLQQTLQGLKGRIHLDIELKESGYEEELVELIQQHCELEQVIVTSFLSESLRQIRQAYPPLSLGILVKSINQIPARMAVDWVLPHWRELAQVDLSHWPISLPLIPWTVNSVPQLARWLRVPQIWGVITDQPQSALALRAGADQEPDFERLEGDTDRS